MDRDEYLRAKELLRAAADAYYRGEESGMDDAEYDILHARVVALESARPDWAGGDSLSRAVGHSRRTSGRGSVTHSTPMLSLDNVFDRQGLVGWLAGLEGAAATVEPKLDGLAISAIYRSGTLESIATRGDGKVGEDVTDAPVAIRGLPGRLRLSVDLEIRGEVCMTSKDFEDENRKREQEGDKLLSNPRNAAAGAMLALPGRRQVGVSFWAYDCVGLAGDARDTLSALRELGVQVSTDLWSPSPEESILDAVERLGRERPALPVAVDGAVVKVSSSRDRELLGETGRAPRWAVAYKYPAEMRRSVLRSIDLQVGRGGSITPVGRIDKVKVGGAEVSSVTLHNPSDIRRKDLRVGDTVWVRRAGEVIPEIVGPDLDARPEKSVEWTAPTRCPDCRGPVDTSGARLRCVSRCGKGQSLEHAAGRGRLDIEGAGPAVIAAARAAGIIHDIASLYDLRGESARLADMEVNGRRLGEARAERIARSAEEAARLPLDRHLAALGIEGVGPNVASALAAAFRSISELMEATEGALAMVENVGAVRAAGIREELTERRDELLRVSARIRPEIAVAPSTSGTLDGVTVAITGRLALRTRTELTREIESRGGRVTSDVGPRTRVLVCGEGGGGKRRAALQHGVTMLDEKQFESVLDGERDLP